MASTINLAVPQPGDAYYDHPIVAALRANAYAPQILELQIQKEAPDAAAALVGANEFDGTTTAAVVDVKSSDANDTSDPLGEPPSPGTGARTIMLLGIAGGVYATETIILNGTTAVTSATEWERIVAAWVLTTGSGGVPAGAITVHETGGTTETYLTIAAGTTFNANARFYIPTGYFGRVLDIQGGVYQAAAAASVDIDAGLSVFWSYVESSTLPRRATYPRTTMLPGTMQTLPVPNDVLTGSSATKIDLYAESVNTAANMTFSGKLVFLLWSATRGLPS